MDGSEPMRPGNMRIGSGVFDKEKGAPVFGGLTERYTTPVGPASEAGYAQNHRIGKVSYSHDAMIDLIIANPRIKQNEIATTFGYSVPWVSRIMGSDAFQAALAKRREEVTDPFLIATVEERLKGLALQSLDIIAEKLESTKSADLALKSLDISTKAMGFGAREKPGGNGGSVTNQFVVNLPPKAQSAESWAESARQGAYNPEVLAKPESLSMSTTITRDPTIQPESMKTTEE